MKTETTPVKVSTPHGALYIAVMSADRRRYYDTERGDVTELRPHLRIATDPTFEADPAHADHWTIRGRAYAVHFEIFFEDRTKIEYEHGYQGERWHRGHKPYAGGFRKDNRGEVQFGTATWDAMWKATVGALDLFDASHPGWMDLSRFLLLDGESERASGKAAEARREAAKYDAEAATLVAESSKYGRAVPATTLALYTSKES